MSFLKVEVLVGGAGLAELRPHRLPLVRRTLEVVLLMILESGGQEVVHDNDTDVDGPTLRGEGGMVTVERDITWVERVCNQGSLVNREGAWTIGNTYSSNGPDYNPTGIDYDVASTVCSIVNEACIVTYNTPASYIRWKLLSNRSV